MPYAQIDVNFPDHWKALRLSAEAFKLFVVGLCHAQKLITARLSRDQKLIARGSPDDQELIAGRSSDDQKLIIDGFIDSRALPTLRARTTPKVIEELLAVGLWEQTASGYLIHDYADWNKTSEQIARKRSYDKSYASRKRVVNDSDTSRAPATLRNATHTLRSECDDTLTLNRDPDTGYVRGAAEIRPSSRRGAVNGAPLSAAFACAAFSVPAFLHADFRGKLETAGVAAPDSELASWYGRLRDAQQGQETPADNLKWLRAQFDIWRQPTQPVPRTGVRGSKTQDNAAALQAAIANFSRERGLA